MDTFCCRHNLYKLREERNMKPTTFGHMVSSMQYERRFGPLFTAPLIAGLEEDGTPYLCGMVCVAAYVYVWAKDSLLAIVFISVGKCTQLSHLRCDHLARSQAAVL